MTVGESRINLFLSLSGWIEVVPFIAFPILVQVDSFVLESFDEHVEGAEDWPIPINPIVAVEGMQDHTGPK